MTCKKLFDFHMKFVCLERMPDLLNSAAGILKKNEISGDLNLEIQLVLEEVISNIIIHGYGRKGGYFAMSCVMEDGVLTLNIRDHAVKFNPEIIPSPDLTLPPEERKVGGLGIHMIRKLMDEVAYRYENNENVLVMKKKLSG